MGAFLSEPVKEKVCTDEVHPRLNFGVCSMQGWRFTQEDNHSCFPTLDGDSSLFGVFDGHGGAEVSRYVASLLHDYVLARECWSEGDVGRALSEAFLVLDAHLGSRKGLKVLKKLAAEDDAALDREKDKNKSSAEDDGESEDGSEENVRNLFKEAKMPLEMLMAKYGQALAASRNAAEAQDASEGSPTGSSRAKGSNSVTSSTADEGADNAAAGDGEGASSATSKKGDSGGKTGSDDAPKENGLPDDQPEATKANLAKNGVSGGRSKLRSRSNRIVMTDDDDDEDEDSSDEEYDENSSSLMEEEEEGDGESSGDDDDDDDDDDGEEDLERSITTSDEFALNMLQGPGLDSGCTAVVAVVRSGGALYVANAGDSRCILSRKGRAVDMSVDHKPEDDAESERIREAGGEVTSEGRVNGGLNLSRALGDHAYKQSTSLGARKQMISALPDVRRVQLRKEEDEFMVLACDGIWNSMTSQDVVDFVRERLYKKESLEDAPLDIQERRKVAEGVKLSQICGEMFDNCLAPNTSGDGTGCDNMTAILVTFRETMWEGDEHDRKVKEEVKEEMKEVKEEVKKEMKEVKEEVEDDAKRVAGSKVRDSVKIKEDGEQKKVEEDHGIVLLTPPPSPAPVTAEDEDEEESEDEDLPGTVMCSTEEEEEEEVSSNGGQREESGKGACKRLLPVDSEVDTGVKVKKRKVEAGEEAAS